MRFIKILSTFLFIALSAQASGSVIYLNDNTVVNPYKIDASVDSFDTFYGYNTTNKWSTALSFAKSNTAVFFLAELNDQLALFALFDAFSQNKTGKGKYNFGFNAFKGNAAFSLIDDSGEMVNSNQANFSWGNKYGDGLVLTFDQSDFFGIDLSGSNASGLSGGFEFLTFDASNQATTIALSDGNFRVEAVPAPATLGLFSLAIFGLVFLRTRA